MSENTKFKWVREEPICELIYLAGNIYPSYIQCSLFETNAIGERRFIETKKFKLVEVEQQKMKNLWEVIRDYDSLVYYSIGLIIGYTIHFFF